MGVTLNKKPAWFMLTDRCSYSGLPITHPESVVCSDPGSDFRADMVKLGDRILLVKSFGYASTLAESEFLAFIDDFISRHYKSESGIAFIEDYAAITGGDAESRKKYITYFSNNHFIIAGILYNLPPIYRLSVSLAKKLHLYASRAHAVHTYDQAVALALKLIDQKNASNNTDYDKTVSASETGILPADTGIGSRLFGLFHRILIKLERGVAFFTKKAKRRLLNQYSEKLISYIASIDWQKPGIQPPENILYDDFSSKKVFDAISFVKSEIDTLMEERAAAEAVLRESEAKYRLLVEHAKAGFLEFDYNSHRILSVNDELVKCSGYSAEELLAMDPMDLFTEESQKVFSERLRQLLAGENISQEAIYECITKNKEVRWWMLHSDVKYRDGRPDRANVVTTDVTHLKETESRLLEYQEKLKRLSIRLSMVEEEQRRNMASHLHETIGQELFVLLMQLSAFEKSAANSAFLPSLQKMKAQLLTIIKETKALTFDLSPPVLYDLGFQEALEKLAKTVEEKHNIRVHTYFEGGSDAIKNEIKVILYRNLKELIHNTVKHAMAKNITICFKNSPTGFCVELRDDGIGFDAANYKTRKSPDDGFGLFDIKEKLNYLSGQLTIDSTASQGTTVTMEVPL